MSRHAFAIFIYIYIHHQSSSSYSINHIIIYMPRLILIYLSNCYTQHTAIHNTLVILCRIIYTLVHISTCYNQQTTTYHSSIVLCKTEHASTTFNIYLLITIAKLPSSILCKVFLMPSNPQNSFQLLLKFQFSHLNFNGQNLYQN